MGKWRGIEVIALLLAINCLNMIDRNLPFILAEAIKADLSLSDKQIGLLGGLVFSLVYAVAGLPFGLLADRGLARPVIAWAAAAWSAMTALGGMAQSFLQLAITRFGVAAGEAAAAPAAHSIIGEHFPERQRGTLISIYSVGAPLGSMLGLMLGGLLLEHIGWRMTFIAVGIPGIVLAALAALRLPRSSLHRPAPGSAGVGHSLRRLLALKTFRRLVYAITFYGLGIYAQMTFLPAFLMRVHEMKPGEVGLMLGLVSGIAGIVGLPFMGWLSDRLSGRDMRWRLWISAALMGTSVPFLAGALLVDDVRWALALLVAPLFLTSAYMGPTFSAAHALVPPGMRAIVTSTLLAAMYLFGASLGPFVVGAISDWLEPTHGPYALGLALLLVPLMLALSSWQFVHAARHLRDELHQPGEGQ